MNMKTSYWDMMGKECRFEQKNIKEKGDDDILERKLQ